MAENEDQKLNELLGKIKSLGSRAKEVRSQLGQPVLDRVLGRANKALTRFGDGNGVQSPQPPAQPRQPNVVCPRCGKAFGEEVGFCSGCGFSFQEERRRQQREDVEREKLERNSRMGVSAL